MLVLLLGALIRLVPVIALVLLYLLFVTALSSFYAWMIPGV